ncbi:predicted protein [Nematostella vectensis]|uniref:Peptidase M20 domain-containing protein 2 n=1 Tax=Nematostella vectensis TaxID=45351 RepID=A7RFH7_NEMVE|nr:xaa-Arg dipeptidase [Nematostella vectensis]EDO49722.1 predicted protein [Nematostella vectensis]|eukprot:XP_001641785.1 predicted protein [Nematostella vectensis]
MASLEDLYDISDKCVASHSQELYELSHRIWNKPELGYKEFFAHQQLTDFLESKGFQVTRQYGGLETAFRAEFGSGSGPTVAFLCEYDALPEVDHGCGHNLIAEAGVASGLAIKEVVSRTGNGKVVVMGTPAEEGEGGKIDLINAGCFTGIDLCLMAHPAPFNVAYYRSQSLAKVTATFHGLATHAAASPWCGINALDAAVTAYNGISMLRQQLKPTWRVHGIFTDAGTKPSVIPQRAELALFVRTTTNPDFNILKQKIQNILESAEMSTGVTAEIKWLSNAFASMETNPTLAGVYQKQAEGLGEEFMSREEQEAIVDGSTDMGNVTLEVPGIHPLYCIDPKVAYHTHEFRKAAGTRSAHDKTLITARALARTAIEVMHDAELLNQAREEFRMMKSALV